MHLTTYRNRFLLPLMLGLILITYAVRLYRLDAVPLRGDEAYAALNWTREPLSDAWWGIVLREPHPVGAFALFIGWTGVAGTSAFALRFLPVLSGVVGVAVVLALARRFTGRGGAVLLAGGLWTFSPFLIYHAQDARTLSVLVAWAGWNTLLLLRAVCGAPQSPQTRRRWLWYAVSQAGALYVGMVSAFTLIAHGVIVLALYRQHWRSALRAWLMVGVLSAPALMQMAVFALTSRFEVHSTDASAGTLLTDVLPSLLTGYTVWNMGAGVALALALGAGFAALIRLQGRTGAVLALWVGVPLAVFVVATLIAGGFAQAGYVIGVMPALCIGLALLVYGVTSTPARRILAVLLVAFSMAETVAYFVYDPPKAPDWIAWAGYLHAHALPDDAVVIGTPDTSAEYYAPEGVPLILLPPGELTRDGFFTLIPDSVRGVYVSGDARAQGVRPWLGSAWQAIDAGEVPLGLHYWRRWDVMPDEIAHPLDVPVGDVARIAGYTWVNPQTLLVYWRAQRATDEEMSVLVHLVPTSDPSLAVISPPVAVLDQALAGAVISTRTWQAGTLYRDVIRLPDDLPAGNYTLLIGLYVAGAPERFADMPAPGGNGRYPLVENLTP